MASLEISAVSKRYAASAVLRNVSLSVPDGAFLTLVGPSGCGKSTLLRIVSGLELQEAGEVRIGGQPVSHLRPSRRDIAMVFQSYALYPHMTVEQNIAIPLILRRLRLHERLPLAARLLPRARAELAGNRGLYGARKVWFALDRAGINVARCTVERLMREMGLRGVVRGKKVVTTNPDTARPCPDDKVNRVFHAERPNQLWVSDFTYVPTWSGTVYVAFVIDVFARRIVAGACPPR